MSDETPHRMSKYAKPYSVGWTIAIGIATAIAFAMLSAFFLYLQAQRTDHRLAGEIVAISPAQVTVRNAHGDTTHLIIAPDTELRGITSVQDLSLGQHIMTRGSFLADDTFKVERMRTLTQKPAK